jgi:hypothetical protein
MSNSSITDWMFPHHQASVADQLQDGIRCLMLDVHYGLRGAERIETDLDAEHTSRERLLTVLGPEGVDAAERIRSRLVGVDSGSRGLYLCHGYCELGATDFVATLRDIHEFMVGNPQEVVILSLEDYVEPSEIVTAFAESGLDRDVYEGPSGPPWPRLGELVEGGRRLIVFTESGKPGPAWLRPLFASFQETPYTFYAPAEFNNKPNRGGTGGSLLLLNHWIQTTPNPRPSNAAIVNTYDFLLARARACQQERGHIPNVIAVDFYGTGDLFRVVDTLNGVAAPVTAVTTSPAAKSTGG